MHNALLKISGPQTYILQAVGCILLYYVYEI